MQFPNIALRFLTTHNSTLDHRAHYKRQLFPYGCSTGLFRGNKKLSLRINHTGYKGSRTLGVMTQEHVEGTCCSHKIMCCSCIGDMFVCTQCDFVAASCRCIMSQLHVPARCPLVRTTHDLRPCVMTHRVREKPSISRNYQ